MLFVYNFFLFKSHFILVTWIIVKTILHFFIFLVYPIKIITSLFINIIAICSKPQGTHIYITIFTIWSWRLAELAAVLFAREILNYVFRCSHVLISGFGILISLFLGNCLCEKVCWSFVDRNSSKGSQFWWNIVYLIWKVEWLSKLYLVSFDC